LDKIKNLSTLQSLIKFRLAGVTISPSQPPFDASSVEVQMPYKIKSSTLRQIKFADYSADISISAITSTLGMLTDEDNKNLRELFAQ